MDEETTGEVVEEPTPTELAAEGARGPVYKTLDVRITVRYPYERTQDDEQLAGQIDLTNDTVAAVVKSAVENHIDLHSDAIAQAGFTVNATAEKV